MSKAISTSVTLAWMGRLVSSQISAINESEPMTIMRGVFRGSFALDPLPKREDYPSDKAWLEAERDHIERFLLEYKEIFDESRDYFINLENPTLEQAREYKRVAHTFATGVGICRSILRNIGRSLRLPSGKEGATERPNMSGTHG